MLNKYIELHERYISLLVEYHNAYTAWVKSQSMEKTLVLRRVLKEMRVVQYDMLSEAQETMKESKRLKREKWNRIQRNNNVNDPIN
jgi:hypothetical protein